MTRLDDLAVAATAAPIARPPSMEQLRKRARRHTVRVVASTVTAAVVVAGVAVGVAATTDSSGSVSRSIVATPNPDSASPSTAAPSSDGPRPVFDDCTTTSAQEAAGGASWFNPVPAEVFADPARGVSGPLVAFARGSGALLPTGDGNAAGGKIANAQVNGRDADVEFYGTYGGVNWDSSSGGSSLLEQQGLTEDEMRAAAEQLDAGTTALPQGLVSLGMTGTVTMSTSYCYNQQGQSASITEIRGDQASRYSEAFSAAPRNATVRQFDQDNATFVIITDIAGAFDIANATFHEATSEEWRQICLRVGSSCAETRPITTTVP